MASGAPIHAQQGPSISDSSFNDKVGLSSKFTGRELGLIVKGKPTEVRLSNMNAAKGKCRPSGLGPQLTNSRVGRCADESGTERNGQDGVSDLMLALVANADCQIQTGTGEVVITNDGATILKHMAVLHPAARMVRGGRTPYGRS
jgi:T-complex protein 1 subunit delta